VIREGPVSTDFRLIAGDSALIGEADAIKGVVRLSRGIPEGCYRIEEFSFDPATGDPVSREWGTLTKKRMLGFKRPPATPDEFMDVVIREHGRAGESP
jgi:hypothetical protein